MRGASIIQQFISGLALCVVLFVAPHSATAKVSPASAAAVEKLQDQVRALDKDAAVLNEKATARLEAQDKRIADMGLITAQQANYIAYTSFGITLIVFLASLITYFSAKSRAEKEAKEASQEWFEKNAGQLKQEVDEKYKKLRADLDRFTEQLTAHAREVEAAKNNTLAHIANQLPNPSASQLYTIELDAKSTASLNEIVETAKDKPESSRTAADYFARGLSAYAGEKFESALTEFEKALQRLAPDAPASDVARYLLFKAIALNQFGKHDEAIADSEVIDQRFGQDPAPSVREQVARAVNNKGIALYRLGKSAEAIVVYDAVDERFGQDTSPGVRENVAKALTNKGVTLARLGKSDEAIAVYNAIDQRFGQDTTPGGRDIVAIALVNKGVALKNLGKLDEAIAAFDAADQRFGHDTTSGAREQVAKAIYNKGVMLKQLMKLDESIATYDAIDRRFGQDTTPGVREIVARALVNKGVSIYQLKKLDEAIAVYDAVAQRFGQDATPGIQEIVALALKNKSIALDEKNKN
jgi:tetratricopeptide (TPR) repeat protein